VNEKVAPGLVTSTRKSKPYFQSGKVIILNNCTI